MVDADIVMGSSNDDMPVKVPATDLEVSMQDCGEFCWARHMDLLSASMVKTGCLANGLSPAIAQ